MDVCTYLHMSAYVGKPFYEEQLLVATTTSASAYRMQGADVNATDDSADGTVLTSADRNGMVINAHMSRQWFKW